MKKKSLLQLLCLLLLLPVCAWGETKALTGYTRFVRVPLIRQGTTYTCGIACLHSLLRWASYDMDVNDEVLMESCGTTAENGTAFSRILQYLVDTELFDVIWQENMTLERLKDVIDRGGCVMMPVQAWEYKQTEEGQWVSFTSEDYASYWAGGHWVIACGYDEASVLFMDPSTGGCYTQMSFDALELRWHDSPDFVSPEQPFEKLEHCGLVVFCREDAAYDGDVVQPLL